MAISFIEHDAQSNLQKDLLEAHPCFSKAASGCTGRIHLPVAPKCNLSCRYCNRKFGCANEGRPGVAAAILSPRQALSYLDEMVAKKPELAVVGIAGPGDPLANPEETLETLRLVKERHPKLMLCLSTNGLAFPAHALALRKLGLSHLTLTVNSLEPEILARLVSWVRDGKKIYRGMEGARFLKGAQAESLRLAADLGFLVKLNFVLVPGVNDGEVVSVASRAAEFGVHRFNILPYFPVEGSEFGREGVEEPDPESVAHARGQAARSLTVVDHCNRCRADAAGLLSEQEAPVDALVRHARSPLDGNASRVLVAVATREGALVNQHLGEATEFRIYRDDGNGPVELARRKAPEPGGSVARWQEVADVLVDCHSLLVSGCGPVPKEILTTRGLKIQVVEGLLSEILPNALKGDSLEAWSPCSGFSCGSACSGKGGDCG
jgi:nitrogen fixation protein NifB